MENFLYELERIANEDTENKNKSLDKFINIASIDIVYLSFIGFIIVTCSAIIREEENSTEENSIIASQYLKPIY